jgi:hypothetical protein
MTDIVASVNHVADSMSEIIAASLYRVEPTAVNQPGLAFVRFRKVELSRTGW